MKYKTTQKAVYRDFGNVLQVGYCNLQHLLSGISPDAYTTRIEGWAADVYMFGRVAIVTGYAPFGNVVPSYDLCRAYDDRARAICEKYDYTMQDARRAALNELLDAFIAEAVLWDTFTKKQREKIHDNMTAFINNFGVPRVARADYGPGLYVFAPGDPSDNWLQYCHNIDYLNGWLYGCVQGVCRLKRVEMEV